MFSQQFKIVGSRSKWSNLTLVWTHLPLSWTLIKHLHNAILYLWGGAQRRSHKPTQTDRQTDRKTNTRKALHMSPLCICTGGLKKLLRSVGSNTFAQQNGTLLIIVQFWRSFFIFLVRIELSGSAQKINDSSDWYGIFHSDTPSWGGATRPEIVRPVIKIRP